MRYLLIVFGLLCGGLAFAQSTSTTFSLPDVAADNNTTACLPVTVVNFTGGIEFGFSLLVDPNEALTFNSIQNINGDIPGFGPEDFNIVDFVASGLITVRWRNWDPDAGEDCSDSPSTVTLPDGSVLFEVCYDVSGGLATQHPVEFFNKPDSDPFDDIDDSAPVIFNKSAQCNTGNDAFPGVDDGSVTIGVEPLELTITAEEALYQPGDTYCVDVEVVSGFQSIKGYQFGIQFDNTVLQAVSATANTDLPQNADPNYNLFGGDAFYGFWAPFGDLTESLPDGSPLVTVCFEVIGECGERTDVAIGTIPGPDGQVRPVEANGAGTGLTTIPVVTGGTRLIIDNCNPEGFDVVVDCPDGNVDFMQTDICIPIRAGDDFFQMTDMDYLVTWNPNVLMFTGIGQRNPDLFINVNDDFETDQVGNGVLAFEWDALGNSNETLSEGDLVFEICFTAIGFGGTSPIVIADYLNGNENTDGFFNGLNPTNCAVTVQQPDGVAVEFPDNVGVSATQETCFEVLGNQFTDVTEFELYVEYSAVLFTYTGFTPSLPGVSASPLADGLLRLSFADGPITVPDGTVIGSVCLQAQPDADPTLCDVIGLTNILPSSVETVESAGNSVAVQSLDGEACVLFPNGFGLIAEETTGFINDQVCVPFSVTRLTDVTSANFDVTFNPALLTYSSINFSGAWTGLDITDVDVTTPGVLTFDWSTPNPAGVNITALDTVQVFEVCFDTGPEDGCLDIGLNDGGTPPTTTAIGDGSIVYNEGEVCLEDRLVLVSIEAVAASCADVDDGMIVFEVQDRPNNEDIFIRVEGPPVRIGNTGMVGGLLPGLLDYSIYNAAGLTITGTIEVGVNPANAAVANAGEDQTLSCGDNSSAIISSQGNVGETWDLFFLQSDGVTRREADGTVAGDGNVVTSVNEPGTYILLVTSSAGCTAQDTVEVVGQGQPVAEAGEQVALGCTPECLTLSGMGSSEGANVTYQWDRINGAGDVMEALGTEITQEVCTGGRFRITVTFADLQCSTTDQVIVRDETQIPRSALPTSASLNCDGSSTTLSIGEAEENVEYTWTESGNMTEINTGPTFTTDELGTYVVSFENTVTGCTRMDTIEVLPSSGVPAISFPETVALNCSTDTTTIFASFENVDENTRYLWSTDDGRVVISDIDDATPRVVLPGTYQVLVANGECRDSATVVVTEPVLPQAEAGDAGELSCTEDFQLVGSGSSPLGNDVSFRWTLDGMDVPMGAAAAVSVDMPGTYYLAVTDDSTGCVAIDSVELAVPSGFPQYTVADTINGLGCEGSTVALVVSTNDEYAYRWTDPDGNDAGDTRIIQAGMEGLYTVEITNPAAGCTATEQILVIADNLEEPFVAFRQNTIDITCESGPAIIDATPSSSGSQFQFAWENIIGGETPSEQGNDSLQVSTAGTYRLTITDLTNSCSASREMDVTDNRIFPEVEAVEGMILDCDRRETTIGVNILDQPNDYQIQWTGSVGTPDLPSDTNRVLVTQGGTYNAVVINPQSSCVTTVAIRVEDLIDSIATIVFMAPDSFDCNNSTITVDASGTELNNASAENIVWTSLDGNTVAPATGSLIVNVDGPGAYELAITDATGCTVRDTLDVPAALNTPFAQAGEPQEVECGEMPQLDGTASSPVPGAGVLYTWSASEGGEIISGGDGATPFVSGPGKYQLIVTSLANGCADTSLTMVMLSEQAAADLPADATVCDLPATVEGNLPNGATGAWTTFNDEGAVVEFNGNVATITELGAGVSLVWTLSAGMGCENYSADTTRVGPEEAPNANDDGLQVGGTDNVGTVNVLDNDQRTGPVVVTLLTEPEFGTVISNLNGEITFEAPVGLTGTTTINYEVCSTVCEGLCDQATITIRSDANGADPQVFNAISPNGDGMNETFIFDILDLRPDEFPDNELTIFNRWGDIIYEAKPYNNDWSGLSTGGTEVPEGTYYYVLRLNIGEGDIIRGDVTVVR